MTRAGSKPRSTLRRDVRVRTINPQPTSSTMASAISRITRPDCVRWRRHPVPAADPASLNAALRSTRDVVSAGSTPNSMPVASATPAVNHTTPGSSAIPAASRASAGIASAPARTIARKPTTPAARPSTPPATASSVLSVSNCRTTRERCAPSAARVAISRRRRCPRASSSVATLAHPINSTNTTAPVSIRRAGLTSPTIASRSGTAQKSSQGPIESGNFCLKSDDVLVSCSPARATVRFGNIRPTTRTELAKSRLKGSACSGR